MSFKEKDLPRAVAIHQWIAYHTANIETARRMPVTATAWEAEKDVFQFAHIQLQMTEEKLHQILVDGVIADAEKQIADLRDELIQMGISMGDDHPLPASAPRFVVVSDRDDPPQQIPVTVLPPIKPSATVTRMRKAVAGKRR